MIASQLRCTSKSVDLLHSRDHIRPTDMDWSRQRKGKEPYYEGKSNSFNAVDRTSKSVSMRVNQGDGPTMDLALVLLVERWERPVEEATDMAAKIGSKEAGTRWSADKVVQLSDCLLFSSHWP